MQQFVVLLILSSALVLLAGCGGSSERAGESGESAAPVATKRALPTMPSAQFAAPTTMIRAQSGETISATATLTATEIVSESVGESEEITATEELTATEEVTSAEEISGTE